MRPKYKRQVIWGAGIQALVVWDAIRKIDGSLGEFFIFFPIIYYSHFQNLSCKYSSGQRISSKIENYFNLILNFFFQIFFFLL